MIKNFNKNIKNLAVALFAAIVLASCGSDFMGELAKTYDAGTENVNAAKTEAELNAAVAETNKQAAIILKENKEDWEEMVLENKNDSTEHAEELKTLYQAQAKFKSAENAKRIELQK